ncbi:MAG TPA: VCBS repeat-containing protein [Acidimicrobiales bacterium]|nr:VCBS repeat-containing protein [Acidimicrobiales bacterium]
MRGWARVAIGASLVLAGVLATDSFVLNGTPAAYNYGYYGGGTRLSIITGAGPGGGPHVRIVNPANLNADHGGFMTVPPGTYSGGIYVARGDLNGDGSTAEIVVGHRGVVKIRNADGSPPQQDITPYPGYGGEIRVAAADLDGDGKAEILTAPGPGGGPHVRAFNANGTTFAPVGGGFFAYANSFTGGVYIAAADLNADGKAEVITGAGPGGGPHVRAFNANGSKMAGQIGDGFYAYGANFAGGVRVAAGYFTNSGVATIVTGAGPGGGPHVREFAVSGNPVAGQAGDGWYAYGANFSGGIFVAVGDIDADESAEVVTGAGAGGGPHVRGFKASGAPMPGQVGDGFFAYPANFTGGVTVAAGKI